MTGLKRLEQKVRFLVAKYARAVPWYIERDDLQQEAMIGAVRALDSYDETRGTKPMTWALSGARGAIQHYIRKQYGLRGVQGWRWDQGERSISEEAMQALPIGHPALRDENCQQELGRAEMLASAAPIVRSMQPLHRAVAEQLLAGRPQWDVARILGLSTHYVSFIVRMHVRPALRTALLSVLVAILALPCAADTLRGVVYPKGTRAAAVASTAGVTVTILPPEAYVRHGDQLTWTITVANELPSAMGPMRTVVSYTEPDGTRTTHSAEAPMYVINTLRDVEVRAYIPLGTGYIAGTLAVDGQPEPEVFGADGESPELFLRVQRAELMAMQELVVQYTVELGAETQVPGVVAPLVAPPAAPLFAK